MTCRVIVWCSHTVGTLGLEARRGNWSHGVLVHKLAPGTQRNLHTGLVLGRQVALLTCLQNLKSLYRGLNWAQSHVPSGLKTPFSPNTMSLEQLSLWDWWEECTFQGQGRDDIRLPWCSSQVTWQSYPLNDLLQCRVRYHFNLPLGY